MKNQKTAHNIARTSRMHIIVAVVVSLGVAILAGTFGMWQNHRMMDADMVFWGAVNNNLQTRSFTRSSVQEAQQDQKVQELVSTQTSPKKLVNSEVTFTQTGDEKAFVNTESIGTPYRDYIRYNKIETAQTDATGKPLDYAGVTGVWGETLTPDDTKTTGRLYNQSVLGVMPWGSLSTDQRAELVAYMKHNHVYEYKIRDTYRSGLFGRPTHEMVVTVKPRPYLEMLKIFAAYQGLNHLEDIDPADYETNQPIEVTVMIDGWTHHVTQVTQNAQVEYISSHNTKRQLSLPPAHATPVADLQQRLEQIR